MENIKRDFLESTNTCLSINCKNKATMQCPFCIKLKISSYFCGQNCFKQNWKSHKIIHNSSKNSSHSHLPELFKNFEFTGKLLPFYPLSEKRFVPDYIVKPDYADNGMPLSEIKENKTRQEVFVY